MGLRVGELGVEFLYIGGCRGGGTGSAFLGEGERRNFGGGCALACALHQLSDLRYNTLELGLGDWGLGEGECELGIVRKRLKSNVGFK